MKARLVIKLGALDDLVEQLKSAVNNGPMNGMDDEAEDEMEKYESDKKPQFYWQCPQDGTMVHTPSPSEYLRCPVDNAEMKKVSEEK